MKLMENKLSLLTVIVVVVSSIGIIGYIYLDSQENKEIVDITETITDNHKNAQTIVKTMIKQYEKNNDLSDVHLGYNINSKIPTYGFVIDMDTEIIVSHPNEELIGQTTFVMKNSLESHEQIISTLNNGEKIWVHYDFENPASGEIESKTSLLKLHDGYIFGSGFYN